MSSFREFLSESKNKYGKDWVKHSDRKSYLYEIQHNDKDLSAFTDMLAGVFGAPKQGLQKTGKANKSMSFSYTSGEITLNNKPFKIDDFTSIIKKKGAPFEDECIMPFGKGLIAFNPGNWDDLLLYADAKDYLDHTIYNNDYLEDFGIDSENEDEVDDKREELIKNLHKL